MRTTLQYHGDTYRHISRIITDGGLVTSAPHLNKAVNNSILINKPNYIPIVAYKEGKVYGSDLNGNLDFTFTRYSEKTVPVDYAGNINSIVNNDVPSINYSSGSPVLLLEPARSNLFLNSDVLTNQTVYMTSGNYNISFYGGGTVTMYNSNGTILGSFASNTSDRYVSELLGVTIGNKTITVSGTVTKACLEKGRFATSYIRSNASNGTRLQENLLLNNLYNNGFITSAGFTWFLHLIDNYPFIADSSAFSIALCDSMDILSAGIVIGTQSSTVLRRLRIISTGGINYTTTSNIIKIIIKSNGSTMDLFQNGVKVVTGSVSPNIQTLQQLGTNPGGVSSPISIANMWLAPAPLTDSECISLTTL